MLTVAALYHFTRFEDPAVLRAPLKSLCDAEGVRGSLLIAREGINGTIAGTPAAIDTVIAHIRDLPGCAELDWKESTAERMPFGRMKVRLKQEIVTMGKPEVDPTTAVGRYVAPEDWNALIAEPDVAVIDTRNDYEVAIGTFDGAVDPGIRSFRDFPAWWEANRDRFHNKRIAMFCTGGIRCEKSTNYLMGLGETEVFHLKGGILKYLEEIPAEESLWHGECFVFDQRVALKHALEQGTHSMCHACRRPISPDDMAAESYEHGVSCPHCIDLFTDADRRRFRERQRQVQLAEKRGARHLGAGS
ncbi:oxygen-dependent tRNA uridine(34) hydroxylase TrhO [Tropicimonas marinistellae]|uniref:oxygen-dependent tRNA uridine(34) hydroxylase TrhO n=1 Tax=Tropicimonas marinistellae TaxID=1739787 RepID=UPI0008340331|nr:rhodanese-related sulfurtransferase [Tropicimonas marinistellae]